MSLIDKTKELVRIVQRIDNVELYRKIIDLQSEINDLVQAKRELEEKFKDLKEKFKNHESLVFKNNAYWKDGEIDAEHGPFCSGCWDSRRELIRLTWLYENKYSCPVCSVQFGAINLSQSSLDKIDSNNLSEEEIKILIYMAETGVGRATNNQIARHLDQSEQKSQYYVDKLKDRKLIHPQYTMNQPTEYYINQNGRNYLVENKLLG